MVSSHPPIPSPYPHHNDVPPHVFQHVPSVFFILIHVTQRIEPLTQIKRALRNSGIICENNRRMEDGFPSKSPGFVHPPEILLMVTDDMQRTTSAAARKLRSPITFKYQIYQTRMPSQSNLI